METTSYVVALGSNRRGRHGSPEREVAAALVALAALGRVTRVSRIRPSAAMGPSLRRFANGAAVIETRLAPPALLAALKRIERAFGRRRGRRWGARVIDLDIILWSGGAWASRGLIVPHIGFRERRFVLAPLAQIVPCWRDPVSGRTMRQLAHAVDRPRPRP